MDAVQEPSQDISARARELLEHTLKGAKANSRPDLISRLKRARRTLEAAAGAAGQVGAVRQAAQEALRSLDSLAVDLRTRRTMLSDPARTAQVQAELADVQGRAESFKLVSREWPHTMAYGFATVGADAEFDLRTRIRTAVGDTEQTIDAGDPAENRDQLDAEPRMRLVAEADLTYRRLNHGTREVAANLAAQLALPTPHRLSALPVTPPRQLVAELPDRRRPSPDRPLQARLLAVLLPGYSGIVITLVLSRLLGLHLPAWVVAAAAVGGAVALSAAKSSVERKRQLDKRRADAAKAVRGLTDEFQLVLTKQIRDAVRILQHELRRATAAAVTQLTPVLAEELDTVRASAETARRAPTELVAIAEDLDAVADLRERALGLRRLTDCEPGVEPGAELGRAPRAEPAHRPPLTVVA
jgi:hypothetical protein